MMLSATLLSMLIYTTLYTISVIKFMTCDHNYSLWTWIWLMSHSGQRQDVAFWFQCWKNSSCFIWPVYKVVMFTYLDHWIASWQMFTWLAEPIFLILEGGLLIILTGCMILLSPIFYVIRIYISTVSLFTQLDYGILCLEDAFLWLAT